MQLKNLKVWMKKAGINLLAKDTKIFEVVKSIYCNPPKRGATS
jgi:hypothetical protein